MERNIGDQLNKAFEAYRQVSIEKDNAKKALQDMTEYYKEHTQKLQKRIEDQQKLISVLQAELSATKQPSGEMKCDPCNHHHDSVLSYRKKQYPENTGTNTVAPNLPVNSSVDYQDMLDAFEAIQGKFRQIRTLTKRQKDHLKRFHGGNDPLSDQRFSMPIQCTDRTAEAETPFSSAGLRSAVDIPLPPTSLASRGASPEDRDLVESLTKLSVKFPPSADSEYDFLNSAPERNIGLTMPMKPPLSIPSALSEEEPVDMPTPFVYPTSPSHSTSSSSKESVRGPQQPLWSPELCKVDVGTELATPRSSSNNCAFCNAVVPEDRMNSHLYLHFSPKNEADN